MNPDAPDAHLHAGTDSAAPAGSTTAPDRLLALAIRAFPRRWRREHGDELVELAAELRADGTRDRLAEAADLVRGGWAVRLRNRPPLRSWLGYRLMERPLPVRWHGWMRDDLEGRLLPWRLLASQVWPIVLVWLAVGLASDLGGGSGLDKGMVFAWLGAGAVWVVAVLSGAPARRYRRVMWTKAGYTADGSDYLVPPPPAPDDLRWSMVYVPWGVARKALAPVALPVGLWSVIGGLAALVGALAPDGPFRFGDLRLDRDPNSPLTRPQVLAVAVAAVLVAVGASAVVGRLAGRRALAAPVESVHPLTPLLVRPPVFAALTAVVGTGLAAGGVAGVWPDQAAAGTGAVAVVAGAVLVRLGLVARRHSNRLGRPVTMGDLTVGERVVMVPTPAPARTS